MHRRQLVASVAALAATGTGLSTSPAVARRADRRSPWPAIDETRLRGHIQTLASDFFEGRFPGSRGDDMATTYIAGAMAAVGLTPAGPGGSWFQPFELSRFMASDSATMTAAGRTYRQLDDIVVITRRADGTPAQLADAPLVFAGYGVRAPERGWDDYAGVDWAGKIAVVLVNDPDFEAADGEPVAGRFGGRAMTWYGRWPYKYDAGAAAGAAGVLIVHEDAPAAYGWGVVCNSFSRRFDFVRPDRGASLCTIEGWIQRQTAIDLLASAGMDFEALKRAARSPGFEPVPLGITASVDAGVTAEVISTRNVIGCLPGGTRPGESVLIGAHHDHLGIGTPVDGDAIYNGAIDNASGVAAVLEMARSLAAGPRLDRTLVFTAWAAEEQGLLGSDYYVSAPAFPLETTAAALTIDGLSHTGPTGDMEIVGAGKSSLDAEFRAVLDAQGRAFTPDRMPERGGFYRSDHFPFARAGVPALFPGGGTVIGSGGQAISDAAERDWIARRYHKPQDEYDPAWNLAGALLDITAVRDVMVRIASSRDWPQWNPGDEFEAVRIRSDAARR
jgi:Zn-dependent M28 family amino/carboxypeptidase